MSVQMHFNLSLGSMKTNERIEKKQSKHISASFAPYSQFKFMELAQADTHTQTHTPHTHSWKYAPISCKWNCFHSSWKFHSNECVTLTHIVLETIVTFRDEVNETNRGNNTSIYELCELFQRFVCWTADSSNWLCNIEYETKKNECRSWCCTNSCQFRIAKSRHLTTYKWTATNHMHISCIFLITGSSRAHLRI